MPYTKLSLNCKIQAAISSQELAKSRIELLLLSLLYHPRTIPSRVIQKHLDYIPDLALKSEYLLAFYTLQYFNKSPTKFAINQDNSVI